MGQPNDRQTRELADALRSKGFSVRCETSGKAVKRLLTTERAELAIVELRLTDGPTRALVDWLRDQGIAIIIVTRFGSVAEAVHYARRGVLAFYSRTPSVDELLAGVDGRLTSFEEIPRPLRLDRAMWEYLHRVVSSSGSITAAAQKLSVDRRSLRRMLVKYAPPT